MDQNIIAPTTSELFSAKLSTLMSNPTQLAIIVGVFVLALLVLNFIVKTISFIFKVIIALGVGAVIAFYFLQTNTAYF